MPAAKAAAPVTLEATMQTLGKKEANMATDHDRNDLDELTRANETSLVRRAEAVLSTRPPPSPEVAIASLVLLVLREPSAGTGPAGGSAAEERARAAWRAQVEADLRRLASSDITRAEQHILRGVAEAFANLTGQRLVLSVDQAAEEAAGRTSQR